MYEIYRSEGFRRLDLGAWYSAGVFYSGYMNHFKNYQRRGVEFFSAPMRRLSWIRPLRFGFAFFSKPERFRLSIHADRQWPVMSYIMLTGLWFGLMVYCPRFLHNWKVKKDQQSMQQDLEEMERMYPGYDDYMASSYED